MDNDTMVAVTQFLPIETMQLWDVGIVTDWTNAAVSQKAEADDGDHYFAIDPEDGLEWEPTHWAPMPNSSARHQSGRTGAGERETVARVIHQCLRPVNMANADWDSGAILGADNSWRRSVYSTADHILAALSQSTAGEDGT